MALDKIGTKVLDNVTVAAQSYSATASSYFDLSDAVDFAVGYEVTFNSAASLGIRIDLFAEKAFTTPDFTIGSYDNPVDSIDVVPNLNQKGHVVAGVVQMNRCPKYGKLKIYNYDSVSVTACSLWVAPQTP